MGKLPPPPPGSLGPDGYNDEPPDLARISQVSDTNVFFVGDCSILPPT